VSKAALASLFRALKDNIRVVMLNACYSRGQADAITEVIDCAIGMNKAIGDRAAITFAASFYRALGFGRSVQEAFEQGKTALLLEGIAEESTPELHVRQGIDASAIVLVNPSPPIPAEGRVSSHRVREASPPPMHSTAEDKPPGSGPESPDVPRIMPPLTADDRPRSTTTPTAPIGADIGPPSRSPPSHRLTYGLATTTLLAAGIALYLALRCRNDVGPRLPKPTGLSLDISGPPLVVPKPDHVPSKFSLDEIATDRDNATPMTTNLVQGTVRPDTTARHFLKFRGGPGEVRVIVDLTTTAKMGGRLSVALLDQDAKELGAVGTDVVFPNSNKRAVRRIPVRIHEELIIKIYIYE
jgi:hypothetical protein